VNMQVFGPSDENNVAVAKKFYEAVLIGDWEGVEKCIAKNVVVHEAEGLPYRGEHIGLHGLQSLLGTLAGYWDNMNIELNSLMAGSGVTVGLLIFTGRAKATGKDITMPIAEVSEFENGLISHIRPYYFDTKAMSDALGGA
jgi:ketosteroid isomerase-like protein